jgi:hypothetical protein
MRLTISDAQRSKYTTTYGKDPLSRDGWLTERLRHGLDVLGCRLDDDFDLLSVPEGETVQANAARGTARVSIQITGQREKDLRVFSVSILWV